MNCPEPYRHREKINPLHYEVATIRPKPAKAFVTQHHYSRKMPAPRFLVGLYRRGGALVGVAVFSQPMRDVVLDVLPCPREHAAELGRFVLLDDVAFNGESWFLARAFELALREKGICGVVSFSDPTPRTDITGALVKRGHLGCIYRATNMVYAGQARAQTLKLLPDGTVFSPRVISKIRKFDRNWQSAARDLERFGATRLTLNDDPVAWLDTWLPTLTRPLKTQGNLRYLAGLDKTTRKLLPASKPYPEIVVERPALARAA